MSTFPEISPLDQGRPFFHPTEHLDLHLERVRLWVLRYMRRFSDRLLKADGAYSDRCVGPQEFPRLAGLTPSDEGQAWLDEHQIPSLAQIQERLSLVESMMARRLDANRREGSLLKLPIEGLREVFGTEDRELDLLIAAAAPGLSTDLSRLYCVAWCDFAVRLPTAGFLCDVVAADDNEARQLLTLLTRHGALIRLGLLDPVEPARSPVQTPRLHVQLSVPQRILDHLAAVSPGTTDLDGATLHTQNPKNAEMVWPLGLKEALEAALDRNGAATFCLVGPVHSGRCFALTAVAAQRQRRVLEVDIQRVLAGCSAERIAPCFTNILREASLLNAVLHLNCDLLAPDTLRNQLGGRISAIKSMFADYPGPIFLSATQITHGLDAFFEGIMDINVALPSPQDQRKLWGCALRRVITRASEREALSEQLSRSYRLPPGIIFRATETAKLHAASSRGTIGVEQIMRAIRLHLDHSLGNIADPIKASMTLDRVVLTPANRETLDDIIAFARHASDVFERWGFDEKSQNGRGLSVLFSGPPGTGKTLVAGVLAHTLGKALYRIDLSQIVDKYIGETEKNLARVFDEAERAQAILLFDEADSLFAQRTSVKSSNDRYANLEVNFLLQRLDDFTGVSILTTNYPQNIDEAFQRRIRFKVDFPMPDRAMREDLWLRLMPPAAPTDPEISFSALAKAFEFSGGHIRNAILRAAVRAASINKSIDEEMLRVAATAESRELGQLIRAR